MTLRPFAVLVALAMAAPAVAGPQRRARVSADLATELRTGNRTTVEVIVDGDDATISRVLARHPLQLKKRLKPGAVLEVPAGQLDALTADADVATVAANAVVRSQMALTTETTGADAALNGMVASLGAVNGQGIGESTIICDYLEDVYPQKSGLPKDPIERARSRLVARIVDLYIAPAVGPLFRQMNPATRDAAAVEKAAADMAKAYGYAEHAMGSGPFCVGATPTLGDCALGPSTRMMKIILAAGNFGITDPTASGRLATWYKAVESHPDTGPVLTAYATAFEGFMKMMAARRG